MNLEHTITGKRKAEDWFKRRLTGMYARDSGLWRFSIGALWLLSSAGIALAAMGMPTGFGVTFDVVTGLALNTTALALVSAGVSIILSLIGLKIPRFTTGELDLLGRTDLLHFVLFPSSDYGERSCTERWRRLPSRVGIVGRAARGYAQEPLGSFGRNCLGRRLYGGRLPAVVADKLQRCGCRCGLGRR